MNNGAIGGDGIIIFRYIDKLVQNLNIPYYVTDASNAISTRITNLVTDNITEELESSNKFIVNHLYNNNLTVNGSLNINSNLTVLGETTNLYTDVNIRDKISIINDSKGVAFDLTQKNNTDSILNISNFNNQVFTITKDGNVGIGVTNPVDFKLSIKGNVDIDGEEFKYTISGRDIINDTCNYVLDTSNFISTRITNLVTDNITEELESSNKFIVNHLYNNDLTVNGSVIINSNLTVLGETTYLYTDVNIRDKVSVINDSQGVAFDLTQKNNTDSILNVSNFNNQVFTITKDGNVGIGVTNPVDFKLSIKGNVDIDGDEFKYTISGRDIINDTCNYVLDTSNVISTRITNLVTDNITEELESSNKFIVNHLYNNDLTVNGSVIINSNLTVLGETTNLYTDVNIRDKVSVINDSKGVAFDLTQKNNTDSILNVSNFNNQVFTITKDGNVGIGVTNPVDFKLSIKGNVDIDGEEFKYTIGGRDIINDTCNYVLDTSNVISTRITNLVTDNITEELESSNKFIVNHLYNNDLTVNGSVIINSNLTVLGETTYLYTDVYTTEQLIVNNEGNGVAFDLTQKNNTDSILNVSNFNNQVFTITKDGNVGIGVTNPVDFKLSIKGNVDIDGEEFKYTIGGRDIINDTCNYVLDTSNVISTRITNLVTDNITEELESSNKFIVNHLYNNDLTVNGSVIINSNLTVLGETTYLYTDVNIRDKVSVINDSQGVAFDLTQKNNTDSILNVSNFNNQVFTITKDGNVGIGVTNPVDFKLSIKGNVDIDGEEFKYTIGGRDIINDTCNYVLDTSNVISTRITNLVTDNITEGGINKYYSDTLVSNYLFVNEYAVKSDIVEFDIGSKTTDDLNEGETNKYYSDTLVSNY